MERVDFSLCSGAECLLQIVHGAIPQVYFEPTSQIPASEIAAHILDHLYRKLDEDCLVQGGEVCLFTWFKSCSAVTYYDFSR